MLADARPFAEVRRILVERAHAHRNPFTYADPAVVERILDALGSVDHEPWAEAFAAEAGPHERHAKEAEARGDAETAKQQWLLAYEYHRVARYPCPSSPGKRAAYRRSQEAYLRAARYSDPPLERVEIAFRGNPGEGDRIVAYLRLPRAERPCPVLLNWGGIDSFKEERRTEPYLAAGIATLAMDMPGVADAPIAGSEDAERLWDPVFDWVEQRPELDARRIGVLGSSTGGYWAAKLAHTHRERIRAAVSHGGCAHHAFTPEWIARAQRGEYPFELAETLARAFGRETCDDWVAYSPRLSLLGQGVLDRPCAPLLIVNGVDDSVFPIADAHLLLEHGSPKTARLFAGGHMGPRAEVIPTIVAWLRRELGT